MNRLINADKLRNDFEEIITFIEKDKTKESISKEEFCKCLELLRDCVDEQPTAYDVEKVVAELEEESFPTHENYSAIWFDKAIDIVRKGGVE